MYASFGEDAARRLSVVDADKGVSVEMNASFTGWVRLTECMRQVLTNGALIIAYAVTKIGSKL
jgi:hypothetical protein